MRVSWSLALIALVFALGSGSAHAQLSGTANVVGNVLLKVNGCGKDTTVVTVTIVVHSNGTWSARTSEGFSFSGTDTLVGSSGQKLAFQFDSDSFPDFISFLFAETSHLCARPVALVSLTQKKFLLQLNQSRTKATFTLVYPFKGAGVATGQRSNGQYKLTGDGPWTPSS